MNDEPDEDIEGSTEIVATGKRRNPVRLVLVTVGAIVLVVMAIFVLAYRSSNMDWYVSPPIDPQGRRVHVLLPVGWKLDYNSSPGKAWQGNDNPDGQQTLALEIETKTKKIGIVQEWLGKLGLASTDEAKGVVYLHVDRNVCAPYNQLLQEQYYADRKVHTRSLQGTLSISWAHRAIPIRGTGKEALIIFLVDKPGQERGSLANKICSSMYVE